MPDNTAVNSMPAQTSAQLSSRIHFCDAVWTEIPNGPGVYVIWDQDEVVYVGMAGRNGKGGIRNRLRDHASGQIVNMFAQYLFLARVQFLGQDRINHPRDARQACRSYISKRCSFRYLTTESAMEARTMETRFKRELRPSLNP